MPLNYGFTTSAYFRNNRVTKAYIGSALVLQALEVTIITVTEPAVEGQPVTVVATSPVGVLSYKFEILFSQAGVATWLPIQDGPSYVWTPDPGTNGFDWRVTVTATDGGLTDSETFIPSGPIAIPTGEANDWDTYQLGMGMINSFSTSGNDIAFGLDYPDTTGGNAYQFNGSNAGNGVTWPYLYGPRSRYAAPADKANMPSYAAIYISAEEAASDATAANAEGWYVFGPGVDQDPGNSGYIDYATNPVAWPSTSRSADGLIGVNNGYSASVVWLSDYTGDTGVGGTDSWTEPPVTGWPLSTYQGGGSDNTIHWRSNNGGGNFINQVNAAGMNLMYVYDNSDETKRGIQIGFGNTVARDMWIDDYPGTWQVSIKVTEAGHPNFGNTYTYQWPMPYPGSSYVWDATTAMLKWQWRLDSTPVPADGNDDLYGDNPRVIQGYIELSGYNASSLGVTTENDSSYKTSSLNPTHDLNQQWGINSIRLNKSDRSIEINFLDPTAKDHFLANATALNVGNFSVDTSNVIALDDDSIKWSAAYTGILYTWMNSAPTWDITITGILGEAPVPESTFVFDPDFVWSPPEGMIPDEPEPDPDPAGVTFPYTPNYAFNSSNTWNSYQIFYSGSEMYDTYGIDRMTISDSFIDMHFIDQASFDTFRAGTFTMTVDVPAGTAAYEGTHTLQTADEFSANTQFLYVHYQPQTLTSQNQDFMAQAVAAAGVGVSVLNVTVTP